MSELISAWHIEPAREARYAAFPESMDARLAGALRLRGIDKLYTHQRQAFDAITGGRDAVIVTPTASGKTLCYNLPVLNAILTNPDSRALYMFPTKALSADQAAELTETIDALGADIKAFTYDGDTSVNARKAVRQAGHIVVTNPDMLHSGILPNHTKWVKLFENLKYIVIDELHSYRGVFGSHLANVLRRLLRICEFYGAKPQFICCSATIANPRELAHQVIGRKPVLIDDNGAPSSERHFIFINPPVVNRQLGLRRGSLAQTREIASTLISNKIPTIVFSRSRLSVEVLVTYLKRLVQDRLGGSDRVRAYRGGYLATQRRAIERALRAGEILGVVATNALELGIDIGSLDACVLNGYPGTIASTWQQAGRAGRRSGVSATFMVGNSSPLNQYMLAHPDYFFAKSPESGNINPDNLYILISHLKCACFELPLREGELYGGKPVDEMLEFLGEQGVLHLAGGAWRWTTDDFPASGMSLRSASNDNFMIIDITDGTRVIGEMDKFTVPMLLHEQAIYLHEGRSYQVEKLDWDNLKGFVRRVDADYYTDADMAVTLKVLDVFDERGACAHGEVMVASLVSIYKKMKFDTHENIGWGEVKLPEQQMHTTAFWITLDDSQIERYDSETAQGAMVGITNVVSQAAPLYLMCDPKDISISYQPKSPFTGKATIFIHDNMPGGVGFSEKLFNMSEDVLRTARDMVMACGCERGCPSCVGPKEEVGVFGKSISLKLLEVMAEYGSQGEVRDDEGSGGSGEAGFLY